MRSRSSLERQEVFLIGGQHPLDGLAHAHQVSLHRPFALRRGVGGARRGEAPLKFLLNQGRIFEQSDHFGPDRLIQELLPNRSARAARAAKMPPPIRAEAAIVMNQAGARSRRGSRERVSTPTAADEALHKTRGDGASTRADFVLVQEFLCPCERRLVDERRDRDFDPLLAWSFMVGAVARGHATSQSQRACHSLASRHAVFPKQAVPR